MKHRTFWFVFAFLLLSSAATQAQRIRNEGDRQMQRFRINRSLYFNYDLFRLASSRPDTVELYAVISFVNDLVQFVKKADSLYQANFELTFTLLDSQKNLVVTKTYRRSLTAQNFGDTNSKSISHSYWCRFALRPGKYHFRLELTDLDIRKSLRREREITLPDYFARPVALSDPILTIFSHRPEAILPEALEKKQAFPLPFSPGHFLLSPFPVGADKIQYYRLPQKVDIYFETYCNNPSPDSLELSFRLVNAKNDILLEEKKALFPGGKRRIPQHYLLNLRPYKPGMYVFHIQVSDGKNVRTRQIRLLHAALMNASSTDTGKVDEFGPMRYIVEEKQYRAWENLPQAARDSLIQAFWRERDPSPNTPRNELREEFLRRVRFANANFISLVKNRPGWKTDQGKIYILYGAPKEIIHPAIERGNYQHEIWVYSLQKGEVQFIFRFNPEDGEYRLLRTER